MLLQSGRIMLCIVTFVFSAFLLVYRHAEQRSTDRGQFISMYPQYMMQSKLLFCQIATLQGFMTKIVIFHVTFVAFLTAILLHIVIVHVNMVHHISKATMFLHT
jgi:hypothetical protein